MGKIVVGLDGSDHSKRALEWAAGQARLTGSVVEAVHSYEHNPSWQQIGYGDEITSADAVERMRLQIEEESERAAQHAKTVAEDALAEVDTEGVTVEPVVVQNRRPAEELVERSKDSDLLVVGSRGRGGFTGLVLGSVSQQCAQHASCPVVIFRQQG